MINKFVPLPKHLHTINGRADEQPEVHFTLSKNKYSINGVDYELFWNEHKHRTFQGFKAYVMNKSIMISLFFTKDILKSA